LDGITHASPETLFAVLVDTDGPGRRMRLPIADDLDDPKRAVMRSPLFTAFTNFSDCER